MRLSKTGDDVPKPVKGETMEMTGHRQVKTLLRYHRVGDLISSEGSELLQLSRNYCQK